MIVASVVSSWVSSAMTPSYPRIRTFVRGLRAGRKCRCRGVDFSWNAAGIENVFETVRRFMYCFEHKFDTLQMVAVVATGGNMSIEVVEVTAASRPRGRGRLVGPVGRPMQPAPRVRASHGLTVRGSVREVSCVVARPGFRFAQGLKSAAFAALVVLSFIVAAPGIASLNQPEPASKPTAGDPAWAHVVGR